MVKGNPMGDVFREQMALFTEETGIEVSIKDTPSEDAQTIFEADYLASKESDVVFTNLVGDNQSWVVDGLTVDVADLVGEWGLSDTISSSAVEAWTNADGQTSGFPYVGFTWPIWYNQSILTEAGVDEVPGTYEELVDAAQAIRAIGKQPFAVAGGDWPGINFLSWMSQQYLDADAAKELFSTGGWCSPDVKDGLGLISEMASNGVFIDDVEGYTADTMTSAFFNGDAAMMPSGSWAISAAPDDIRENAVLAGFPVVDGGAYSKPTMFFGDTSTGIWISRNGESKLDLIQELVTFMYRADVLTAFADGADMISVATGDVGTPANPLLAQAVNLRADNDGLILWDTLLPVGVDPAAVSTQLYGGTPVDEVCQTLDQLWADAQ